MNPRSSRAPRLTQGWGPCSAYAKDAFAHLALLELDDNALTEASKPKLKGLAKKCNYNTQNSPDRAVPRTDQNRWYRYVAVGE